MNEQEITASLVKTASIGFTQSLINHGATPEQAAQYAAAYVAQDGILAKKAAVRESVAAGIANMVNVQRALAAK